MNFDLRSSFRNKLLLLTIGPLVVVQVVTLLAVMRTVEKDVDLRARNSLAIGGTVVAEFLEARSRQLRTSVGVLAADFGLKEAVATRDADTIRSVLVNHSSRVGADLAIFLDNNGRLVASAGRAGEDSDYMRLLGDDDAAESREATITIDGDTFHTFAVPLRAPVRIGWVIVGFKLGDTILDNLRALTGLDVAVSTDRSARLNSVYMQSRPDGNWLTMNVPFVSTADNISIMLQRSMEDAMLPYVQARRGLIVFGLFLLALAAIGATWLSGSVAAPLRVLTDAARRMISGNYDAAVAVASKDEFGALATSFNAMRTAIAEREERISHQAMHDSLTDLPNRNQVLKVLAREIDVHREAGNSLCVLSIRLPRMNAIFSTLGHSASDKVITQAARHLSANLAAGEFLGHTGSSEFTLVLADSDIPDAISCAERVDGILGAGVTLGRVNISLQTETGIAAFPQHGKDASDLLKCASIARSEAGARHERLMVYESGREQHHLRQLRIVNDLRGALHPGQVFLNFQPKVSLPDNRFYGVEALVRWKHPEFGLLPPDDFIPAAEEAGTIVHLTRYVLSQALADCSRWEQEGVQANLSVNLSARDLQDEYLPYFVLQELKDKRIPAQRLTLEITENTVMQDVNRAVSILECLRDIGIRISIDDFGTGHSSLAQLKNIPLHELKIDKSFVTNMLEDEQDEAIVATTIRLAHSMRLDVVAEGVENEATLNALSYAGCEQAQGYFLSKPLSSDALLEWCKSYRPVAVRERRGSKRAFGGSA